MREAPVAGIILLEPLEPVDWFRRWSVGELLLDYAHKPGNSLTHGLKPILVHQATSVSGNVLDLEQ